MTNIRRFEDIEAWKKGRELAKDIYAVTGKGECARDYGLPRGICDCGVIPRGEPDQIQRASVSVISNIVYPVKYTLLRLFHGVNPVKYIRWTISRGKGFDSQSNRSFIQFLGYSLRSATEVQSHLYVAVDQGYISKDEFAQLYDQATEGKKLISGFTPWNNVRSVLFHGVNSLLEA